MASLAEPNVIILFKSLLKELWFNAIYITLLFLHNYEKQKT
jgi:hypothetical protein